MEKTIWIGSLSGPNRKSKTCTEPRRSIQNPKWLGLFAIVIAFVGLTSVAEAQQPTKIPRIGVLSASSPSAASRRIKAFQQGLRELGYIDGTNIKIEYRYAQGKSDQLAPRAAELVELKVDIILAQNNTVASSVAALTKTIPIVIFNGRDPVAAGLVASLARPGGNITGLTNLILDLGSKRLELLKDIVPKLTRLAILSSPGNPLLKELQTAASTLQLQVHVMEVRNADDLEPAFTRAANAKVDALMVAGDPTGIFQMNEQLIVKLAAKNRLPGVYPESSYVEAGGLSSYAANDLENYRRAATYVDKILKGAKPADLPVEQPRKFDLVINLKTAKQIGVTIPPNVLLRADRVIK
jgi:putative tryptophan/tyrosine transport system substrate-binding protein